jgi:D-methionine transport system permease protein
LTSLVYGQTTRSILALIREPHSRIELTVVLIFPTFFASLLGLPLGTLLYVSSPAGLIAAAPFIARIVETALSEVDAGVLLAARAMGSTNTQIIRKVLIPETLPALVSGLALTVINLIGYSAMAGAVGCGGLGDLAIRYGYYRFRIDATVAVVIIIRILAEAVQLTGTLISRALLAKR